MPGLSVARANGASYVLLNPLGSMGRGVTSRAKLAKTTLHMQEIFELTAPFDGPDLDIAHIRFPNTHSKPLAGCEAGTARRYRVHRRQHLHRPRHRPASGRLPLPWPLPGGRQHHLHDVRDEHRLRQGLPGGVGKSTAARLVADRLVDAGAPVHVTNQPSRVPLGDTYRGMALACLCAADRHHQLTAEILPALRDGTIVVCDRYVSSSLVLQGLDGVPAELVWQLNHGVYQRCSHRRPVADARGTQSLRACREQQRHGDRALRPRSGRAAKPGLDGRPTRLHRGHAGAHRDQGHRGQPVPGQIQLTGTNRRRETDLFGAVLAVLRSRTAKSARGQFYTPACVGDVMAHLVGVPNEGDTVVEPAVGTGGLLRSAAQAMRELDRDPTTVTRWAVDIDELAVACLAVNTVLWELGFNVILGHDRDPGSSAADGQPVDEHGLLLCASYFVGTLDGGAKIQVDEYRASSVELLGYSFTDIPPGAIHSNGGTQSPCRAPMMLGVVREPSTRPTIGG